MLLEEQYREYSEEIIKNNSTIQEYEKKLNEREIYINNLLTSNNIFEKLIHPIKLIRTKKEKVKIDIIRSKYDEIRNTDLFKNMKEEEGVTVFDLENAARSTKPKRLIEFSRIYSLDDNEIYKKLLKVRK